MTLVRVYIPVQEGYHGTSWLMETTFDMDFLPSEGDTIHPCKNDPDNGWSVTVNRRYWDEQGKAVLEIGKHIIDPEDGAKNLPRTWHSWYSDRDSPLIPLLRANGWWEYLERVAEEKKRGVNESGPGESGND